jgi:tryptophan synthase alpha chain
MNRIDALFRAVRDRGRPAFAAYITAGDPDLVPFSDPIADGPVIQRASQRSLAGGTTLEAILDNVRRLRGQGCEVAITLFGAYNPFLRRGLERLCQEAREAGADGLLVADLPPDEADELRGLAADQGLGLTFLLAPTSGPERIRLVAEACSGYVYCVSLRGVTGARQELPSDLVEFLSRTRAETDKPVLVGFGISKPEHIAAVAPLVDAIVVGSAFVKIIEEHATAPDLPDRMATFARHLMTDLG